MMPTPTPPADTPASPPPALDRLTPLTGPLPPWLARVADDPVYDWALSAWRRAAAVPGSWFDAAKADAVVAAWPRIFRLTDDRFRGVPFRLLPWQEITVRLLVGWKRPTEVLDPATHREVTVQVRVFRRLDLWIPRKNGKSEFLAALGVLFFALEKLHGAQGFVFAANEKQGRTPFGKMQEIIRLADGIQFDRRGTSRVDLNLDKIFVKETRSLCLLLSGKPTGKHGGSASMILGDEIHEWTSREVADTLHDSIGARLQPIELYASTAGNKASRIGWEWYQESVAILRGEIEDARTLVVHFAIGDEDDWTSEAVWRAANPTIGLTPTWDSLREEFAAAKGHPAKEARFQAYHLNRWVESISAWLPRAKWRACTTDPTSWKSLWETHAGRRAFAAIDVSATRDITAAVWLLPPDETCDRWVIIPRFWIPEATLDQRAKEDRRVDWHRWISEGALRTTPGDSVDQQFVLESVLKSLGHFRVESVGFDPWNAQKLITDLQAAGMPVELQAKLRQGAATLGEATKSFEIKVYAGAIEHGGHPVLAWMAGHCAVRFDPNLNYVPSKGDSRDKIDGIIAAVMALTLAESVEVVTEPTIEVI